MTTKAVMTALIVAITMIAGQIICSAVNTSMTALIEKLQ